MSLFAPQHISTQPRSQHQYVTALTSTPDGSLHRILDNLPVAMVKMRKDERSGGLVKTYERGFPVGFKASLEVRIWSP